jgi:hypothetical protein
MIQGGAKITWRSPRSMRRWKPQRVGRRRRKVCRCARARAVPNCPWRKTVVRATCGACVCARVCVCVHLYIVHIYI